MKTLLMITMLSSLLVAESSTNQQRALIAYMKVKPGTEQEFLKLAEDVVRDSRKEAGNIHYQLHQSVVNPQLFVFYELFKTDADLQFHRNSPHVKSFLNKTKPITVEFILEEYVPEGEAAVRSGRTCENVAPFLDKELPRVIMEKVGNRIKIVRHFKDGNKTAVFERQEGTSYYHRLGNVPSKESTNPWYDEVFDSTVSGIVLENSQLTLLYDTESYPVPRYYHCND